MDGIRFTVQNALYSVMHCMALSLLWLSMKFRTSVTKNQVLLMRLAISSTNILAAANQMVSLGLQATDYQYVNIDASLTFAKSL